ncbi:MAG: MaoC family dehydratase N-terminal domain-containing protein [Hyphomonas sp.]|jgi:3-methylfumaryl-CoA hydratase
MDTRVFQDWIGRTDVQIDTLHAGPARALAATLDQDPDEFGLRAELPPLWLWLYFLPAVRASGIGADGHPQRGGFLPPVALPRRMWAGSRCRFHGPVRIGDELTKVSTITGVSAKTGRNGEMVFVTVRHAWSRGGAGLAEEEQDIVYMPIPDVFSPPPPVLPGACEHTESVAVDPVMLFRFSALTFNGHRIHYDRTYAMHTEKYPGLVVHGPLQAILLMEAARRWYPGRRPSEFTFRGLRPLFDFDEVSVSGRANAAGGLDLFTVNGEGAAGMQATLGWAGG